MTIAFVFAGQGVQKVGMGTDLLPQAPYKEIFSKLDDNLQNIIIEGPKEDLDNTLNAQPAIVATSLGIANILKSKGIEADYVAGLSLGEYSALAYSGVLSLEDTLEIVKKRGQIMADALPQGTTGMLAVMNADLEKINEVVASLDNLQIANYNSPKQIVLTGSLESIDRAVELFKEQKIRAIKLNVSGAFHSDYLVGASEELYSVLKNYNFNETNKKVVYNTLGTESDEEVASLLKNQIKSSVRFMQSVEYMIENGVDTFVEIGPGKVLSGLIKQINSNVKIYNIESEKSIDDLVEELNV
ncbi:MAG: ACP S-malonyltransferase [Gemella sp.]|nr:ACP S-malonyltransferase [Gemella sp.]